MGRLQESRTERVLRISGQAAKVVATVVIIIRELWAIRL